MDPKGRAVLVFIGATAGAAANPDLVWKRTSAMHARHSPKPTVPGCLAATRRGDQRGTDVGHCLRAKRGDALDQQALEDRRRVVGA